MSTGLVVWSQTAASNATADSNVNWAEGMAPSAVNNSARAEMASMAKWRDDINGSITTSGSSTAYTVTSNQTFAALTAGYMIAFTPHTTNGGTTTINVDGLGAKPLRQSPGVELATGHLVQGTPYVATYYTSNSGEWLLHGFYGDPYTIPIGGCLPYFGTSAPNSSFIFPYGQAISRTTYSSCFSLFGTTFGSGDGSTTFNVPDLRGRIMAGVDNMGGTSANVLTSTYYGATPSSMGLKAGSESNTLAQGNLPNVDFTITATGSGTATVTGNVNVGTGSPGGGIPLASDSPSGGGIAGSWTQISGIVSTTVTGTAASGGSGTGFTNLQPTMLAYFILRII